MGLSIYTFPVIATVQLSCGSESPRKAFIRNWGEGFDEFRHMPILLKGLKDETHLSESVVQIREPATPSGQSLSSLWDGPDVGE
jgi:hypothetical protein